MKLRFRRKKKRAEENAHVYEIAERVRKAFQDDMPPEFMFNEPYMLKIVNGKFVSVSLEDEARIKLTKKEKFILENTDKEYKYIARDECGGLYLYSEKPTKGQICYWSNDEEDVCHDLDMFDHLFQDIKWEDEEPLQFRNDRGEFIL